MVPPLETRASRSSARSRSKEGMPPVLTVCACRTMEDSWAWRKTSASSTLGTSPQSSRSLNTLPGPTGGSWSASPTSTSCASEGSASSRAAARGRSSMEHSSTSTASASRGLARLRAKLPPMLSLECTSVSALPSYSSSRWMVWASYPVTSNSLWAARPVGAQSLTRLPMAFHSLTMVRAVTVLPQPGPPVSSRARVLAAVCTEASWVSLSFSCATSPCRMSHDCSRPSSTGRPPLPVCRMKNCATTCSACHMAGV
mmetsp:Transcript_31135/g.87268  ORF Transcript_31135/g.87268 Transcript_31135/m.87268 type:complete len:256 (+) Transcript_31135:786-1553(+)